MARNTAQNVQATAQQADLTSAAMNAVTLASDALEKAKAMLQAAGGDVSKLPQSPASGQAPANSSRNSNTSTGRIPSAAQLEIRELITAWAASEKADIFTIKSMTEQLGKDRVQTRNAINYLTEQGVLVKWAEKLPEGRGAREFVYKPATFNVGI